MHSYAEVALIYPREELLIGADLVTVVLADAAEVERGEEAERRRKDREGMVPRRKRRSRAERILLSFAREGAGLAHSAVVCPQWATGADAQVCRSAVMT